MGRLSDFIEYLQGRLILLRRVEQQLCALQQKYETFFGELSSVRETEVKQLIAHLGDPQQPLPAELQRELATARAVVEGELDARLAELGERHDELVARCEELRETSREGERALRERNVALDDKEEQLKTRNAELLARIEHYNQRIKSLGGGFGFFYQLPRLRQLNRESKALEREQRDVAARIEQLRGSWAEIDSEQQARELEHQQRWVELRAEADGVKTKLDYLRASRPRLVLRSCAELVLFEHYAAPPEPAADDPPCPRCQQPNPPKAFFCRICGQRLGADQPDFAGSLAEIAEINHHHRRFSGALKAGQELIGLVRGLISGLEAFSRSVNDVQDNEQRYPLPKLAIDVPQASVAYGALFDDLAAAVADEGSLHPSVFAARVERWTSEVFTEAKIHAYFGGMGDELSRCAEAQW